MNENDPTFSHRKPVRRVAILFGITAALLAAPPMTQAQTNAKKSPEQASPSTGAPTAKTHPNDPMIWDEEQMVEEAVTQITRHYNLGKTQEDYTRLLLKTKVRAFLEEHDMEVRELLQESIDLRRHPEKATPERLMDWALRAGPVYDAAKKAILDGNATWRDILDEKQIKVHDRDLRLMTANFSNVTDKLQSWQRGEGYVPGVTRPKPQIIAANATGQVSQGSGGQVVRSVKVEDQWGAYVNRFIRVYHLDEAQQNSARESILKEQMAKADKYREQKKGAFKDVEEKMALKGGKKDQKESMRKRLALNRRRRALEQPIHALFIDMNDRLNGLPRIEQKANLDAEQKQELDRQYRTLAGIEDKDATSSVTDTKVKADEAKSPPSVKSDPAKKKPSAADPKVDGTSQKNAAKKEPKPAATVRPKSKAKPAPGLS